MIRRLRALRRRLRRDDGTATVEFVILFPLFVVLLVTGVEMGVLALRQVMLERGMDMTVRVLRVGTMADPSYSKVREQVCRTSLIIPNCTKVLHLELTKVSKDDWAVPATAPSCVDRKNDIEPVVNFTPGLRNEYMLMRACAVFSPLFPTFGLAPRLPLDASGGYRIIASTAFVNEP